MYPVVRAALYDKKTAVNSATDLRIVLLKRTCFTSSSGPENIKMVMWVSRFFVSAFFISASEKGIEKDNAKCSIMIIIQRPEKSFRKKCNY